MMLTIYFKHHYYHTFLNTTAQSSSNSNFSSFLFDLRKSVRAYLVAITEDAICIQISSAILSRNILWNTDVICIIQPPDFILLPFQWAYSWLYSGKVSIATFAWRRHWKEWMLLITLLWIFESSCDFILSPKRWYDFGAKKIRFIKIWKCF